MQRNKLLNLAGMMPLEKQLQVLQQVIAEFTTPLSLEREVLACAFFTAKKDVNKHVLTFNFHLQGVLARIVPLVEFALGAAGGERVSSAPPKGQLFK
ncbi:unnamed protein product [Prorocentrum cordatum]|uniref:Uncharacterized protein n=2 Tax=Prorocentrum cordatum TaxID=2364126 RepID=A0ABN9SKU3_9DINO|nr:unnamed protein product [Polarella glacialis]